MFSSEHTRPFVLSSGLVGVLQMCPSVAYDGVGSSVSRVRCTSVMGIQRLDPMASLRARLESRKLLLRDGSSRWPWPWCPALLWRQQPLATWDRICRLLRGYGKMALTPCHPLAHLLWHSAEGAVRHLVGLRIVIGERRSAHRWEPLTGLTGGWTLVPAGPGPLACPFVTFSFDRTCSRGLPRGEACRVPAPCLGRPPRSLEQPGGRQ